MGRHDHWFTDESYPRHRRASHPAARLHQSGMEPIGYGQQTIIRPERADDLYAHRQAMGANISRQIHGRHV